MYSKKVIYEFVEMLSCCITDLNQSEEDLDNITNDFNLRYPDYKSLPRNSKDKNTLDRVNKSFRQYRYRSYIRNVFSALEGIINAMKQSLIDYKNELSDLELIKIQEKKYVGPSRLRLKEEKHILSHEENIRFVFSTWQKIRKPPKKIKLEGKEWKQFKDVIQIRNRIIHPKKNIDLVIKKKELKVIKESSEWFLDKLRSLLAQY